MPASSQALVIILFIWRRKKRIFLGEVPASAIAFSIASRSQIELTVLLEQNSVYLNRESGAQSDLVGLSQIMTSQSFFLFSSKIGRE